MLKKFILPFLWLLSLIACHDGRQSLSHAPGNAYAKGFTISSEEGITKLTVRNPWEQAKNVESDYYLVPREAEVPTWLVGKHIIRTPVERIICLSTSHIAFLDALGVLSALTGISGDIYVSHPEVRRKIDSGEVRDVGYGLNLNYEEIISQRPDVVMVYGVDSEIAGFLNKFHDLGIPAVLNAEYLEEHPLGKAEWVRFVATMFGKEAKADSIFDDIAAKYIARSRSLPIPDQERESPEDSLSAPDDSLSAVSFRLSPFAFNLTEGHFNLTEGPAPVVMVGLPYRESWWIPGGESYLAQLIRDAGGIYVAADNTSHESFVVSMEEAIMMADKSDVWINIGMVTDKQGILAADSRFGRFPLFEKGRIYNNNKRMTPGGGNDFWESGTMAPHIILTDLIKIFHPSLLPDDTLTYYREIR